MAMAGDVCAKKMFGEYAVYCDEKLVGLVCDDQLYIKPTLSGRAFIGRCIESAPYQGAKLSFLISTKQIKDAEWLSKLVRISAVELPQARKKRPPKS